MRITEYQLWAFFIGLTIGSLLTRWQMNSPEALISRVQRVNTDIYQRIEDLASVLDLTPAQEKMIKPPRLRRLVDLDELIDYYYWASQTNLDPITITALAIICEKVLGLTRMDAVSAMRQAKLEDDFKWLLTPQKPSGPSLGS